MTVPDILEGIFRKQHELRMTNQQFSDASGVPKASIERIKRGDTPNPTMQTILDLAAAVGYTFSNHQEKDPPLPDGGKSMDPMVQQMINYYERRSQSYEEQIKRITAYYNMLMAEKNRWIQTLSTIIGILIVGFISFLLMDIATPELGWFPHDASAIAICIAIVSVAGLISGVILMRKKMKE